MVPGLKYFLSEYKDQRSGPQTSCKFEIEVVACLQFQPRRAEMGFLGQAD